MECPTSDDAVVCDFGLGRRTDDINRITPGRPYGPLYATAPEVRRGEAYGPDADTYALGMLVWDMTQLYMRLTNKTSMPATVLEMILGCIHQQKEDRMSLSDAQGCLEEFLFDHESGESLVSWVDEETAWAEFTNVLGADSESVRVAASNSGFTTFSW
jgi:hypothetical protein